MILKRDMIYIYIVYGYIHTNLESLSFIIRLSREWIYLISSGFLAYRRNNNNSIDFDLGILKTDGRHFHVLALPESLKPPLRPIFGASWLLFYMRALSDCNTW